jgi:hypothetical protein
MIRVNLNSWIGRAAMACALLIPLLNPGLAHAATPCTYLAPSFYTYQAPAAGMPISSSAFYLTAAPAGCSWTLTHNQFVTLATDRGTGSGWVYFGVAANYGRAPRTGTIGTTTALVCDDSNIGGRSAGCYYFREPSFLITLPQASR